MKIHRKVIIKIIAFGCILSVLITLTLYPMDRAIAAEENGISISTADDLFNISNNTSGNYYLTNDIDLKGMLWEPIKDFGGSIDGRGYKIKNLTSSQGGLISSINWNNNVLIKNIKLSNVNIRCSDNEYVGGLVNKISTINTVKTVIENCSITGKIEASSSGSYAGGLIGGILSNVEITSCINKATVKAGNSGGIVGKIYYYMSIDTISISKCVNLGSINGQQTAGIVCYNSAILNIDNCYNGGLLENSASGIIYNNYMDKYSKATLMNCLSTSTYEKGYGISGSEADVLYCYYLREASAGINKDVNGSSQSNSEIKALTRKQLTSTANFENFDFDTTWSIIKGVNNGYPLLTEFKSYFNANGATASIKSGTYTKVFNVTLKTDAPDAKIYYTLDGSVPTVKSKVYSKSIKITKNTTLKTLVVSKGYENSSIKTYSYKIKGK